MSEKKLARHLLPQIPGDQLGEFCRFMQENGISHKNVQKPAKELRAIQSEVNRDKIESFKQSPEKLKKPILISKTGWILDGHHRGLAAKELDPETPVNCVQFDCTINELVALGHKFEGSFRKTVHEATSYSRKLWELRHRRGETVTTQEAEEVAKKLHIDFKKLGCDLEQFRRGMEVELEHVDVTDGDLVLTGKIALVHLKEMPDYYVKLAKMEGTGEQHETLMVRKTLRPY